MRFIDKTARTNWKFIAIVAVVVGGGVIIYSKNTPQDYIPPIVGRPSTDKPPDTSNFTLSEVERWQTYRNEKFGFEVKYPLGSNISSLGPNYVQQKIERGETISGTVQPSFDTITFSEDSEEGIFRIEIFSRVSKVLSQENYENGYLYLFGRCDLRADFIPVSFEEINVDGTLSLKVTGKERTGEELMCIYTKNSSGNLMVISNIQNSELINQMLPTFRFIEPIGTSSGWQTYRNEGFEFQYPATLGLEDIRAHIWPPKITIEPTNASFSCDDVEGFGDLFPPPSTREETILNGIRYCVIRASEGAAGTIYQGYKYTIIRNNNAITLEFAIRYPSDCKNYSDSVRVRQCEKEMKAFNSTDLADQILSTFRFIE